VHLQGNKNTTLRSRIQSVMLSHFCLGVKSLTWAQDEIPRPSGTAVILSWGFLSDASSVQVAGKKLFHYGVYRERKGNVI